MTPPSKIRPMSKKQHMILHTTADTAIIGGAMGSGKSYMALLFPLKYCKDPYFRGVIFRKTTGELTAQGGLWETAVEMYTQVFGQGNIKVHKKDLKITFPSGASLKFSHMERDANRLQHQGAQYTFCLFDESTHFSKLAVEYLGLRIRSARATHKKQMILTCNPDPDWFGLDWIRPYLQEDGTPNLDMDGVLRYYVVDNNEYKWADTREELEAIYGCDEESGIKSFTFISATCYDNPVLLANNKDYISTLKAKAFVDVQRYLYGNWYVRPDAGGYFKRAWLQELDQPPPSNEFTKIVRAWDFAGSLPNDVNGGRCDYTAAVKMGKLKNGNYVILDIVRHHIRYGDWSSFILEQATRDGTDVDICLPIDPNPAAMAATQMLVREIVSYGFYVKTKRASSSKLDRFRPFSSAAQNGLVSIVRGCCTDLWAKTYGDDGFYYNEMEAFDGGRKGHDDCCDATADAFMHLASKTMLVTDFLGGLQAVDLSMNNPLLTIQK